ncbi:MAG TPA: response regulator, partial [Aggregatilineales bacterium]|nr:response regulator [Aggregatilineales bacterium]
MSESEKDTGKSAPDAKTAKEASRKSETKKSGAEQKSDEKTAEKKDEAKDSKSDVAPAKAESPGAGKNVLIVEDTLELAEVIQATLERLGVKSVHKTHAAEAMELLKTEKPDLILLDIGLPDMSGWKFLDSIKELNRENLPGVIIITAYGDPANRLMGKLQDVTSYL